MPTITRTFIKTAMVLAVVGVVLSALSLVQRVWELHPVLGYVQPTALHLIVVGWLTQLIFGVALWMFPPRSRTQPRGPEAANWACYGLLNGGLLLRLVAEPLNAYHSHPTLGWILVTAALLQLAAVWIFVALVWIRVRAKHHGR